MRKCENCENGTYKKKFCSKKCYGEYKSKNTILVDKETLYDLYHKQNLTAIEIADKLNCSVRTVFKYIEKYNFEPKISYNDYKDKQVGDLLFLEPIFPRKDSSDKHITWKTLCKRCNKECSIQSHTIDRLINKCCPACSRFSKRKGKYLSGVMLQQIKASAKIRKIEFNLTLEYLEALFEKQNKKCCLTGIILEFAENAKKHQTGFTTASLDRIDNTKGYIEGNVWWLHKRINIMKLSDSTEDFVEWCKKVSDYSKSDSKVLDKELNERYTRPINPTELETTNV